MAHDVARVILKHYAERYRVSFIYSARPSLPILTARFRTVACVLFAAPSLACNVARTPVNPAAAASVANAALDSLSGRWDFNVDVGTRQTPGELWLFRRGNEMTGTLAPTGTNTLPVRSFHLRGDSAHMIVDTPDGPVTFDGVVATRWSVLRGVVTYHQGQRYPMTANKRAMVRPG